MIRAHGLCNHNKWKTLSLSPVSFVLLNKYVKVLSQMFGYSPMKKIINYYSNVLTFYLNLSWMKVRYYSESIVLFKRVCGLDTFA